MSGETAPYRCRVARSLGVGWTGGAANFNTKPCASARPGLALALFSSLAVDVTQGYNAALLQLSVEYTHFHQARDRRRHSSDAQATAYVLAVFKERRSPGWSGRGHSERFSACF
jgi:hypothetical protein